MDCEGLQDDIEWTVDVFVRVGARRVKCGVKHRNSVVWVIRGLVEMATHVVYRTGG